MFNEDAFKDVYCPPFGLVDTLRKRLGLPWNATDKQIYDAFNARFVERDSNAND